MPRFLQPPTIKSHYPSPGPKRYRTCSNCYGTTRILYEFRMFYVFLYFYLLYPVTHLRIEYEAPNHLPKANSLEAYPAIIDDDMWSKRKATKSNEKQALIFFVLTSTTSQRNISIIMLLDSYLMWNVSDSQQTFRYYFIFFFRKRLLTSPTTRSMPTLREIRRPTTIIWAGWSWLRMWVGCRRSLYQGPTGGNDCDHIGMGTTKGDFVPKKRILRSESVLK